MPTLRRSIPSLSALATFEAAARLTSFTNAAAELGVTQAAVSRQIKLLEHDLNTRLFVRANRKVVLTASGAALAATVSTAFDSMAEMIETIRQPISQNVVEVGASMAFCHFWILPRLSAFRAQHPLVKLKLIADDGITDLRRDRLDLAFRFGKPPFADARSLASTPDEAFPVCSPALLRQRGMTADGADLVHLPLIASDILNPSWLTWRSWALGVGLGDALGRASDRSGLHFNHYIDTIQAAVNGEGVALGWSTLLKGHLDEGRLVRLGRHSLATQERYHLLVPNGRVPSAPATTFIDWVISAFG
ncbi:LysR family transcriptional regulator [bacterium]|nr:LysR family transcriptional regulator [bacterium]